MQSFNSQFRILEHRTGPVFRDVDGDFPASVSMWVDGSLSLSETGTHYGFVQSGSARITCASGCFDLSTGMYFSIPGSAKITADGLGMVSTRLNDQGFFLLGGPIETTGRLRYIDGCSDSLLIGPTVLGAPCLNLLHIPPGTQQTRHTHPSLRSGIVVSGSGCCVTPEAETPLVQGLSFVIPAEAAHSFHTDKEDLLVVAWHPDSDTGPCHDNHPMVNRTIVDGVSAAVISEIRT